MAERDRSDKKMTLLEKALALRTNRGGRGHLYTYEEIDLAFAFVRNEISTRQVSGAMGFSHQYVYAWTLGALRAALKNGRLKEMKEQGGDSDGK